ncbi:MAG: ASCH domain-containing protein [Bacillota bacterium]|nr:MAG: ASCH domain-containing protein [Bacillota bacterium]
MDKINQFWNEFLITTGRDKTLKYQEYYHFELTEYWANELLRLVLIGQKQATASSYEAFILENERLPQVGDLCIITDFHGNPKCVVETTQITILPFNELTYDIVKREGEDENLESWRKGHEKFFRAEGKEIGYAFSEDMKVVFEDFKVIYKID